MKRFFFDTERSVSRTIVLETFLFDRYVRFWKKITWVPMTSYGGVNSQYLGEGKSSFILSNEEMAVLDGLDVEYRAGKLGRIDGWTAEDIAGIDWDPTLII